MTTNPIAYIDADIIMHRALAHTQTHFGDKPIVAVGPAMSAFNTILEKWLKEAGPTEDYALVMSKGGNFRKKLYPDYKANRKDLPVHPSFKVLKEALLALPNVIHDENIEADDLIGIKVTEDRNTICVSADKDFLTIPCTFVVPTSHNRTKPDVHRISEKQADYNWLIQAMTGDTIDNYKGIPKVGPVKARNILTKPEAVDRMWPKVLAAFQEKGMDYEYALLQARLARILRHGEYNFETKEVRLWQPKLVA